MNWYHLNEDGNLVKCYMVDIAFKEGETVPTEPLIEAEDWAGLAALGWYREYLEPHRPYRDGYRGPVIAPHPADGFPCAFTAPGERYTLEELRAIKAEEVTSRIPQFTGTELASDFRLGLRVADVVTWASKLYARIAATEDWDAVADIDTSLLDPLGLTQGEVATAIRNQVENILLRDGIRSPLGYGMPVARREELQGHLRALNACVGDPEGIPAVPAAWRQQVYVPDESEINLMIRRRPHGSFGIWQVDITSEEPPPGVWIGEYGCEGKRCGVIEAHEVGSGHRMANQPISTMARIHHVDIRVGSENNPVTDLIRVPPEGEPMLIPIYHGGSVSP